MQAWIDGLADLFAAFDPLLPWLAAVVVALAVAGPWRYRRLVRAASSTRRPGPMLALELVLAADVVVYLVLTLSPGHQPVHSLNLVPFLEVQRVVESHRVLRAEILEVLANVLFLAPWAALLGVRCPRWGGLVPAVLTVTAVATAAEVLQYALELGRVSSVTDVLEPAIGAAAAWDLATPWRRRATSCHGLR